MRKVKNILHWRITVLVTVIFLLLGNQAWSQQEPAYTQYMNNLMSVNPAYTAVRGVGSFSGIFRNQWINLDGAPKSTSLSFGMPLDSLNKMGLGADFIYDYTVPLTTTEFYLDYSYRVNLAPNSVLSLGLKAGFNYLDARLTNLDRYHLDDEYILGSGDFTKWMFNTGVGVFWYTDQFYLGFSVPRLIENKYNDDETGSIASREKQHYFIHGAYMLDLSPDLSFKPGLTTIMTAGAPVTADFDFSFVYKQLIWAGVMYRISDAVGGYVQFQYKNMKLGFSYDYSHTRIRQFQAGTFEIMLRYDFKTRSTQSFPLPTF